MSVPIEEQSPLMSQEASLVNQAKQQNGKKEQVEEQFNGTKGTGEMGGTKQDLSLSQEQGRESSMTQPSP